MPTPASLLSLQDTLERHPDARKPILDAEIARRETEIILLRSHRSLLHMQLWNALQTSIIVGLVVFSFGAALSGLVQVSKATQRFTAWSNTLSGNILTRSLQGEFQSLIPTSTALEVAGRVPFWNLRSALWLALTVAITILVIRFIQSALHWRASRLLKHEARRLSEEVITLKSWL